MPLFGVSCRSNVGNQPDQFPVSSKFKSEVSLGNTDDFTKHILRLRVQYDRDPCRNSVDMALEHVKTYSKWNSEWNRINSKPTPRFSISFEALKILEQEVQRQNANLRSQHTKRQLFQVVGAVFVAITSYLVSNSK